jgi:hypothetical protein
VRIGVWVVAVGTLLGLVVGLWRQSHPPSPIVAMARPSLSPTLVGIVLVCGVIIMLALLVLGEVWTGWWWQPASERQRARWALATIAASSAYFTTTVFVLCKFAPQEGTPEVFVFAIAALVFQVLMTISAGSFLEHLFHYPERVRERDDSESMFWTLAFGGPAMASAFAFFPARLPLEYREYMIPMTYDMRLWVVMTVVLGAQAISILVARRRIASLIRMAAGHEA